LIIQSVYDVDRKVDAHIRCELIRHSSISASSVGSGSPRYAVTEFPDPRDLTTSRIR
jgi:hypothetical protein